MWGTVLKNHRIAGVRKLQARVWRMVLGAGVGKPWVGARRAVLQNHRSAGVRKPQAECCKWF